MSYENRCAGTACTVFVRDGTSVQPALPVHQKTTEIARRISNEVPEVPVGGEREPEEDVVD